MPRLAVLAVACLVACLTHTHAHAQAAPAAVRDGYSYCVVTDTGSTPAKIWASPVFAFSYPSDDIGAMQRLNGIAAQFLQQVNARGGAGDKRCALAATQAEAQTARNEEKAIWDKRMYFIKIGDWRELAWTPAPWSPADNVALPAQVTRYFFCYAMQTDVPGRVARSRAVASQVFDMPVPTADAAAVYTQARDYSEQFKQVAQQHNVGDAAPMCTPYDTRAEADKAMRDGRRLMDGFNQDYAEVAWRPTDVPIKAEIPPAEVQVATPAVQPPSPPVAAPTATPAPAAPQVSTHDEAHLYCTGFVQRGKPELRVRAPVEEQANPRATHAQLATRLNQLLASVQHANPGKWFELPAPVCYENSAVFQGETFCVSTLYKHFGGLQQTAMFCNASRELIDARWRDMEKADGGNAQVVAWPAAH